MIPLQFIYAPGHDPVNADNWAVFGTAIWNPLENLTITGGLRYTDEHKDFTFNRANPDGSINPFLGALTGVVGIFDGNRIDYRVSVDYRFSPEVHDLCDHVDGLQGRRHRPAAVQPGPGARLRPGDARPTTSSA